MPCLVWWAHFAPPGKRGPGSVFETDVGPSSVSFMAQKFCAEDGPESGYVYPDRDRDPGCG